MITVWLCYSIIMYKTHPVTLYADSGLYSSHVLSFPSETQHGFLGKLFSFLVSYKETRKMQIIIKHRTALCLLCPLLFSCSTPPHLLHKRLSALKFPKLRSGFVVRSWSSVLTRSYARARGLCFDLFTCSSDLQKNAQGGECAGRRMAGLQNSSKLKAGGWTGRPGCACRIYF